MIRDYERPHIFKMAGIWFVDWCGFAFCMATWEYVHQLNRSRQ